MMINTKKFAVSMLVTAAILSTGFVLPGTADAAAAAKPAGCMVKTTRSPAGTQIGAWKCVGTHWQKTTVAARKPYVGLFGLGEPMLKPAKA
ncbi:MAG: hypothetical protein ABI377_09950 [Devosia sp.]